MGNREANLTTKTRAMDEHKNKKIKHGGV